ncbi:MAG: DUF1328 domain-containing protein [Chthoniobacteraceae bacterium]
MLYWAFIFLVMALLAAVLGFGGLAGASTDGAKICFFVFFVAFLASLVLGRRPPIT